MSQRDTVLVTGATGIVGRMVVYRLLQAGERVRATRRSTSNIADVAETFRQMGDVSGEFFRRIEWCSLDLQDIPALTEMLSDVGTVYHTAATVSFDPGQSKNLYEVNVVGTRNLLYAMEAAHVPTLCHISSVAVFDGVNADGLVDETCDFNPKLGHSAYALTKYSSEMEVWRAAAEGLQATIINPGIIIGSGNWQESSGTLFKTALSAPLTFSGVTGYVDVRDVATLSIDAVAEKKFGQNFIAVAENCSYEHITNQLRALEGLRPVKVVPDGLLRAAGRIGDVLGKILPPIQILNSVNTRSLSSKTLYSNQKSLQILPQPYIPIADSLQFHWEHFKNRDVP